MTNKQMWHIRKVSTLLLLAFFFISCSGEEHLQNPQTTEEMKNHVEDVENPKVKVAVRIGARGGHSHITNSALISELYNIVVYNNVAINLLELPSVEFVRDDSTDGTWDYMIEFGLFLLEARDLDGNGSNLIYWIILQNADNSDGQTRTVFYPDISLGTIGYVYEPDSIGNKVVEQKQYAPEGEKAKIAINIHKDSGNKEQAYNSIARALVVLPDVEFESDSSINGEWDYMVKFRTPSNSGTTIFAYWTTLQNADNSDSELRTVFYPEINIKVQDFAELQNVGREIVGQFRSKYLDAR